LDPPLFIINEENSPQACQSAGELFSTEVPFLQMDQELCQVNNNNNNNNNNTTTTTINQNTPEKKPSIDVFLIYLFIYLFICLFVCLFVYLFVYT